MDAARTLLAAGADVNAKERVSLGLLPSLWPTPENRSPARPCPLQRGWTSLHLAAHQGHAPVVQVLLRDPLVAPDESTVDVRNRSFFLKSYTAHHFRLSFAGWKLRSAHCGYGRPLPRR